MEDQVKKIMSSVFNVSVDEITENASQDTLPGWDSLRHMDFVVALEEAFGIELDEEQIIEMMSYKLVLLVLKEACSAS